ncbi:MAG: hypothetical protein OQJ83_09780 [Altibacter sp.]|nr:hypothetical protein [Altibacter sp.]
MNEEIRLFVQYKPGAQDQQKEKLACLAGADALVIDPCNCTSEQYLELPVENTLLLNGDPQRDSDWLGSDLCHWICTKGLNETSRLRDQWPQLNWVPQLTVYKPSISYRFSGPAIGEGFSFYIPDTAAIKGWQVTDGDVSLTEAITQATELGFNTLWLHSQEAELQGKGLALEMLEKTHGGPLAIWISGGVTELKHLSNLARVDGAAAVVVNEELARETGMEALQQALVTENRIQEVPVHFIPKEAQTSEV